MDHLPPHLVIGIDDTWYTKEIHGHVHVSQSDSGSNKMFCSVKICFRQRGIKPNIAFILWGTCMGIKDFDKQSYEYDVLLS